MVGKEGMTKEEIYNKLKIFNEDESKLEYLEGLERRSKIMKPSTRKAFYDTARELKDNLNERERSKKDVMTESGYLSEKDLIDNLNSYRKHGDKNLLKSFAEITKHKATLAKLEAHYATAAQAYEAAGEKDKAKQLWNTLYCMELGSPRPDQRDWKLIAMYEDKLGIKKSKDLGELEYFKKNSEKIGDYQTAMSIQRRIEHLKNKKQKGNPSLEDRTHLLGIVGASFLGSLIFSSKMITGNVISGSSFRPGSFIGILLFVLGIVGLLFYFNKK